MRRALLLIALTACAPTLDSELRQSGHFTDLAAFEAEGRGFAAALRDPQQGRGKLTLVRLDDGTTCEAGLTASFFPRHGPGDALALVAWQPNEPCGAIAFFDAQCQPLMEPIPCTGAPRTVTERVFGGAYRDHLVLHTEDERLLLVQPWSGEIVEPAAWPVHAHRWASADRVWLHAGDRLLLTALDGSFERVVGEAVSEVAFSAAGAVAFVDGGALRWLTEPDAEPKELADDVCELRALGGREALAYLSPCESRRLVLHELGAEPIVVGEQVTSFRHDTSELFFLTGTSNPDVGPLSTYTNGSQQLVDERASLASVRKITEEGQTAHLLLAGDPDEAELLRFDGVSTERLHDRVVDFDARHHHLAVLTELSGATGKLWLSADGGAPELLAEGVPRGGFGYATQLEAFGFIANSDGRAGTLEVVVFATGDRLEVASGVTEFAELRSDEMPGLAYVIASGEGAGIWFAAPE